jgi:hypothetical protein
VEGKPLRGALPDPGQAGELGDQAVYRRREQANEVSRAGGVDRWRSRKA